MLKCCIALLCCAALCLPRAAFAQSDPYVELEQAKFKLAEGKLNAARDLLSAIDASGAEEFVREELAFQRMLIDYSQVQAITHLLRRLEDTGRDQTEYAGWLRQEWGRYAERLLASGSEFMELSRERQDLEFIRFRLPHITEENLQDLELFADEMVLTAAIENWAEGRGGLGRALVSSQARVALVLAAAIHYDKAEAGESIGSVQDRLRDGVLIDDITTLDWLSSGLRELSPGWRLRELADEADRRILQRTEGLTGSQWRRRAEQRLSGKPAAQSSLGARPNESTDGASG